MDVCPFIPVVGVTMADCVEISREFARRAADPPPEMEHKPGTNIAVSLSGDDADELRGYWTKLSDGGNVAVPLEKQMWGDEFGMCTDKFGLAWMVIAGQKQPG